MSLLHRKFLSSVVSINVTVSDLETFRCIGTGVIVDYKKHYYIVTNTHVVEGINKLFVTTRNSDVYNKRYIKINMKKESTKSLIHPDSDVDIIVIELGRNDLEKLSPISTIPLDSASLSLLEMKKLGVFEGDIIYSIGHPVNLTTKDKFYPIVRVGSIAQISNVYDRSKKTKEFLIDCFSYPGNSGGPVFLKPEFASYEKTTSNRKTHFIGILNSNISRKTYLIKGNDPTINIENIGLSNVICVDHIFECIKIKQGDEIYDKNNS